MKQEKRPVNISGHQQNGYQPALLKKGLQPGPIASTGRTPSSGSSVQRPTKK